jgi:sugar phosphate isomerase/epimerase
MRLTVSTHSFEAINLEGTLAISRAMGFKGVDIAGFHNRGKSSYEPDEVGENPQKFAADLRRLLDKYELDAVDFFPQFGSSPNERSLNDPDAAVRQKNFDSMRGIAQFCKLAGIPGVTILPGVDHVERPLQQNLEAAGEGLKKYTDIFGEQGVMVRFEPHMGSVAYTPELALQLVETAPQALITLDYSHYLLQYIPMDRIHKMIPYTGHVHIRQARPGKLQTRFVEGTIDFVDIARRLEATGYKYCLSVEYVCSDWYDLNQIDTLTETVVTKAALDKHIKV